MPFVASFIPANTPAALERFLLRAALSGLTIVALLGVLMRAVPLMESFPLLFKNVLHAHSHFAFGGWVTPILLWMLLRHFPQLYLVAFVHWKRVAWITVIAAYGMLFSFPFGGYGPASIFFSTLSLAGSFYSAFLCWKATGGSRLSTSALLLRAGVVFLLLSSIGPLATGPLIATGQQGTPLYFNAIYWYLHFQFNGWFTMVVLAIVYKRLESRGIPHHGSTVARMMIIACLPAFALSLLWMAPPAFVYIIGGGAALLQLAAIPFLIKDMNWRRSGFILRFSIAALVLKLMVQAPSALPFIAAAGYAYRNFFIAYLHLVLVGFVSLYALHHVMQRAKGVKGLPYAAAAFVAFFILTELLLVVDAAAAWKGINIAWMEWALFLCSIPLPLCAGLVWKYSDHKTASGVVSLGAAA